MAHLLVQHQVLVNGPFEDAYPQDDETKIVTKVKKASLIPSSSTFNVGTCKYAPRRQR